MAASSIGDRRPLVSASKAISTIRRVTGRYPATPDAESRARNTPRASVRHPGHGPIAVVLEPTLRPDLHSPAKRRRVRSIVEAQLNGRKILTRRSSAGMASGGVQVVCRVGLRSVGRVESRSQAQRRARPPGEDRCTVRRLLAPLLAVFVRTEKETGPRQGILKKTGNCSKSGKTPAEIRARTPGAGGVRT